MSLEKILYTAEASATGGRDGRAVSSNDAINVRLSTPRELGGAGGPGTNPEQLFAAGYSACFPGAMMAKHFIRNTASAILLAGLASSAAASDLWFGETQPTAVPKTRAHVLAELDEARGLGWPSNGELPPVVRHVGEPRSRASVRAEALDFIQLSRFANGETYPAVQ